MNKIEENGAAKEEIIGCHKKCKMGQRTKSGQKGQKQGSRGSKNQGKKEAKGEEIQGTLGLSKKRKRDGKKGTNRSAMKKR